MAEIAAFSEFLRSFAGIGGFSLLLPFLLSFIVFYAASSRVEILKDKQRIAVSVIMSMFVSWFLVKNPVFQAFFTGYFGRLAIGLVGILGFLVFLGLIGYNPVEETPIVLTLLVVIGVVGAFTMSGGMLAFVPTSEIIYGLSVMDVYSFLFNSGVVYLLIIGAFIYWSVISVGEDDDDLTPEQRFFQNLFGAGLGDDD